MYLPEAFRETRPEVLHALMRDYSFGTLISHVSGELFASHLPFLLDAERGPNGTLLGHVARANPQWQALDEEEVLVLFQGPHAYVSPSWYQTQPSVPTWNYVTVHARGTPRLLRDDSLRDLLARMVGTYEAELEPPWNLERLTEGLVEKLQAAIVGFEIPIARLEGKWKLGQNRSPADRQGMAAALAESRDPGARELARLVRDTLAQE